MMEAHEHAVEKGIALATEAEAAFRSGELGDAQLLDSMSDTWVKIAHELRVGRSKRQYVGVRADAPLAPAPDVNAEVAAPQNVVTDPATTGAP